MAQSSPNISAGVRYRYKLRAAQPRSGPWRATWDEALEDAIDAGLATRRGEFVYLDVQAEIEAALDGVIVRGSGELMPAETLS